MNENLNILIIDDDPGVREAYREILLPPADDGMLRRGAALFGEAQQTPAPHFAPYRLTLASRGEEAVEIVATALSAAHRFAAAFIDMKMPGIDGAETARRISSADPGIKIVIVTAYSEYTPADIIARIGRQDIFYLRKPFNPEEIRQFARALTHQWNLEEAKIRLKSELETAYGRLAEANRNLEQKVQQQAAQLVQSEKMASLGILTAGLAHEINNPVAAVQANLQAMDKYVPRIRTLMEMYAELETRHDAGGQSPAGAALEKIARFRNTAKTDRILADLPDLVRESLEGIRRVGRIVADLRQVSRGDTGRFEAVDINRRIDAVADLLGKDAKNKAAITRDLGRLPPVRCDPGRIDQVLINVLSNAVQAIETTGEIKIATRLVKSGRRESDKSVEISISDTGCGITPEHMKQLFDPFFTTKAPGEGTGLGLSISYDIVRAHGGRIDIDSTPGRGTTVRVTLPVSAASDP